MLRKTLLLTAFSIFLLLLSFCDAPRENPFDPKASNYTNNPHVTSTITVQHLYPPFKPIANAQIIVKNLGLFLITNQNGKVTFEHPPVDTLKVLVAANGYFPEETTLDETANAVHTIYLNAMPEISGVHFVSNYNNFEQTPSTTSLSIQAHIYDPDSPLDLKAVYLFNSDYHFSIDLTRDPNNDELFGSDFYVSQISSELTNAELPELNFFLIVKNLNGDSLINGPYTIRRVIEAELKLLHPADGETVQDSVVFQWINPELSFDYVFNIEILKFPSFESTYYRGIPGDANQFTVKNLAKGRYSWRLEIEDKLGNLCQSYYINFYYE